MMLSGYTLVKIHLLVTVILTQITSIWIDKNYPYFPIEVSRSAASGYYSMLVFNLGIQSLIITMFISEILCWDYFWLYVSLSLIAYYDDVTSWHLHMIGVMLLFITSINLLRHTKTFRKDVFYIGLAVFTYALRIVLKVCVIYNFEVNESFAIYPFLDVIQAIKDKGIFIMYHGSSVCFQPFITITIFKFCAVGQWIAFWLLSQIIHP
jgi:hypothetical protein